MPHPALPRHSTAHIAAFCCVVALHGGLLWWQMRPQPAVALPQQQVVRVAMISAPATPEPVQETVEIKPAPAKKGMVKAEEKPPQPQPEEKQKLKPQPVTESSGQQAQEATAQHAAVTEPIPADYLQNPPPVYPRSALRKRQQGTVMLEVQVNAQGLPQSVRVQKTCGHRLLDEAALEAVRQWRFVPARRGNEQIAASVVVPVEFRIN